MYTCSKCNIAVIPVQGTIITPCSCEAPIIADASASVYGVGGVSV